MRIYDGGAYVNLDVIGDYAYWADDGLSFMIECKATKLPSLPFSNFKPGQLDKLLDWNGPFRHSVIALNFYGENYRQKNDCYLIHIKDFLRYQDTCGRKSIPEKDAARIGVTCPKLSGYWDLPFHELREVKCTPAGTVRSSSRSMSASINGLASQRWGNALI